jgi:hypothetical protein
MLLNKLNINLNEAFILGLSCQSNVGKSTALTIIASELINKGYSIAFISEEPSTRVVKRLKNLVYVDNGKCRVFKLINGEFDVQKIINVGNFDFVLCDGPINIQGKTLETIKSISSKQKVSFLFTIQAKLVLGNFFGTIPTRFVQLADYIVILTNRKPNWFDKIKKLFGFTIKNRTFALIKNRLGSEKKIDYFIDFNYINK